MLARPTDIYVNKSILHGDNIAKYWASNVYARVNNLLRNYDINVLYKETPHMFTFLQHFIKYFQKKGMYADDVGKISDYISWCG